MQNWTEINQKLKDAITYIKKTVAFEPEIGIILGTGLGSLVDGMELVGKIEYDDIPHFPTSTVESHHGRLLFGHLRGKPVVCMQGRFHYYEGYSFRQIAFPVRVMKQLGVRSLIVSNAAGGLNPKYKEGDIMMITDHINFLPGNPLIGDNDDNWGPRFTDCHEVYNREYIQTARAVALEQKLRLQEGIYIAVTGPNLETAAEYRMFRTLGGDAVGMSTIPEVMAAHHQGNKILAFSIITDMGLPDNMHPCSIESVLKVAAEAEPKLRALIAACVERM
ncbi:MAG: purine-nucleoside phosphorylase [candidate division Zixibacteria bacterium]|nr:purine-nucleoside phosphorylase [candidate division Zixibacteria bacterium]